MRLLRQVLANWRRRRGAETERTAGQLHWHTRGRTAVDEPASAVGWRSILALNTDEFCRNTSIHGLKYINSRRLHAADR